MPVGFRKNESLSHSLNKPFLNLALFGKPILINLANCVTVKLSRAELPMREGGRLEAFRSERIRELGLAGA